MITITPSQHKLYKATLYLQDKTVVVHFGTKTNTQYPVHKDIKRKENYLSRHKKRENWDFSGITTPGFWSRWILWNKPTIEESIEDTKNRFNVDIKFIP